MKSLAALVLALTVAAAPAMAQPGREHGGRGGMPAGRPAAPEPHWNGGGGRGGPFGEPRGGEPRGGEPRGGESRGGYPGGYSYDPRGGADPRGGGSPYGGRGGYYAEPRGYGYPAAPPPVERRTDSLGANWGGQQDEVRNGVRQGRYVGLARVIGSIRQRTPGRQLDAGLEQWGGREVYRVRWAEPGGRRTDYIVDAQSGAILHVDGR